MGPAPSGDSLKDLREKDDKGWAWNTRSLRNLSCASPQKALKYENFKSRKLFGSLLTFFHKIIEFEIFLKNLDFSGNSGGAVHNFCQIVNGVHKIVNGVHNFRLWTAPPAIRIFSKFGEKNFDLIFSYFWVNNQSEKIIYLIYSRSIK